MVIIDAGHGGSDYGGGSNNQFNEKDLNLLISLYQYNRLKELGIPVALTRDSDIYLSPTDRISKVKSLGNSDLLISNHINASGSNFSGSEIIYSISNSSDFANLVARKLSDVGRKINRIYTRMNSRGNDYYYIIRETKPTQAVIVEYGFADNPEDATLLLNNYELYAEAVVEAIADYLGYNYGNYYEYTVKNGDSLYKIANKTGVSINEIKQINNLSSDKILAKQVLKIPYRELKELVYYPLGSEKISEIAKRYSVNIDVIKERNKDNKDKLIIPLDITLVPYILKPGDTLFKIAMNHGITLYQLATINNITINNLTSGDVVMVPKQ